MASNRIVQAIYDLKDLASAKLQQIGDAFKGNAKVTDESAASVEKSNTRLSDSFKKSAENVGVFHSGLLKLAAAGAIVVGAIKGIAAAVGTITSETEAAASLEDVLTRIGAKSGATAAQLTALRTAIDAAVAGTRFSVEEAAKGVEILVAEGSTIEQASRQIGTALQFVQASGLPLETALGGLSDSMGAFGLQAESTASSADTLAAAALKGGTGLGQLLEAMVAAGPAAQTAGLNFKTTAAIIATLAQSGLEGAKAGESLVQVLQQFQNPASAFKTALASAGVYSTNFAQAMAELSSKGGDLSKVFLTLGGPARSALERLLADGGAGLKAMQLELENTTGFTQKLSDAFNTTAAGAFTRFKNAVSSLGIGLIEPILKPLAAAFDTVRERIEQFTKTPDFGKLKDAIGTFATTAAKNITDFVASVDFTAVSGKLTQLATDASATFKAIAGGGNFLISTFQFVAAGISATVAGIKVPLFGLATAVSGALDAIVQSFNDAIQILPGVPESIKATVQKAADELEKTTLSFAKKTKDAAIDAATGLVDMGKAAASIADASEKITTTTPAVAQSVQDVGTAAAEAVPHLAAMTDSLGLVPDYFADVGTAARALGPDLGGYGVAAVGAAEATKAAADAQAAHIAALQSARDAVKETHDRMIELAMSGQANTEAFQQAKDAWLQSQAVLDGLTHKAKDAGDAQKELQEAFKQLGLQSQADLDNTAKTYTHFMDTIVAAAGRGQASQEDVKRAFIAAAQAQLAAVRDSDAATQAQVEAQIKATASALGVVDALKQLGLAGKDAGDAVADGASRGADALDNLANNANAAANATSKLAQNSNTAAQGLQTVSTAANDTGIALGDVSQAFLDAATSAGNLDRIEFGKLTAQQQAADAYVKKLNEQIADTDELADRVKKLRGEYNLLSDNQLRNIAEKEKQLAEQQTQREADLKQQQDQLTKDKATAATSTSSGGIQRAEVTINHLVKVDGLPTGIDQTAVEQIVRNTLATAGLNSQQLTQMVISELMRSKRVA
jgi:TP901 family phage tail tape measure protein